MVASGSASPTMAVLRSFRTKPSSLFNGYVALAARNLPFTGLQFPLFEFFRSEIHSYRGTTPETASLKDRTMVTALAAGSAGSIAAVITTPIDVVKTRVMLRASDEAKTTFSEIKVFQDVLKAEGIRGLWKGGALRAVWTFVGSGLYLGVYDGARVYLGRRRGVEIEETE